ncbi:UAS domain-containing protein [Cavenderia fasciculata]|uniref:UAS domain-containing protein n=1 Tax=Cavenderia fasciculata TaxID=261658 RepID=F4PK54_CACFS|nr:UAS domain-containing protein [Cavenderia fasciculata]EGG23978.1 UAS domain-containing protein [Cavenderia fasciculata]|eukprot:XP_004361829.1 UAS domain-containing protein [Cavenderia fasciculata]
MNSRLVKERGIKSLKFINPINFQEKSRNALFGKEEEEVNINQSIVASTSFASSTLSSTFQLQPTPAGLIPSALSLLVPSAFAKPLSSFLATTKTKSVSSVLLVSLGAGFGIGLLLFVAKKHQRRLQQEEINNSNNPLLKIKPVIVPAMNGGTSGSSSSSSTTTTTYNDGGIYNYLVKFFYKNAIHQDPVEETRKFYHDFFGKYGNNHPNFRDSSYNEAVQFAKSRFKILLIYVHSEKHPDAQSFCQEVLFTDSFTSYINENFVIWACDVNQCNGLKIANSLEATTYPYIAMLCCNNVEGISNGSSVMRLEALQGATITADNIVSLLTNAASAYEPSLVTCRIDHEEREADRLIRMTQDEEYNESLARDQEKARLAQEAEMRRQEEEEREAKEQEERLEAEAALQNKKDLLRERFLVEPKTGAITRLAIRLVDGSRVQRNFLETDTIQTVLDFVDSRIEEPIETYVLNTNYPKELILIRTHQKAKKTVVECSPLFFAIASALSVRP